jgi:hypothetical protein
VADRVAVKDKVSTVSKTVLTFDRVSAHADERRSKFNLRPVGFMMHILSRIKTRSDRNPIPQNALAGSACLPLNDPPHGLVISLVFLF